MSLVIQNDAGVVAISEQDWTQIADTARRHGWDPDDPEPEGEEIVGEHDAVTLASCLREALDKGEVQPNELIDDADAEEKLEELLEMCDAGALCEG